jgi:hypothetical protein
METKPQIIVYCRDIVTGWAPSNYNGTHMQIHKLIGSIYQVRRSDSLKSPDMKAKVHWD